MKYKLQVRQYERVLTKALVTSRESITTRKGLIVRLEDAQGRPGFGEVAPLAFMGSESFEQAIAFLFQLNDVISEEQIREVDSSLPCCRFGLDSASEMLKPKKPIKKSLEVAALLSLGDSVVPLLEAGYETFKFKIGKEAFGKERDLFVRMQEGLSQNKTVRIDANGFLSLEDAQNWLKLADEYNVQYLEQPLQKGQEALMVELSSDFKTPIALDESVVSIHNIEKALDSGWPGWFVIKPALLGDINKFRELRKNCKNPITYSSVFESSVGIEAGLTLASEDNRNSFALGYGTLDYFTQDEFLTHEKGPTITSGVLSLTDCERIWKACKPIK